MAEIVVAITGENANGILECQSQRFLDLMRTMGLEGRLLRMGDPDFIVQLHQALQDGIRFAWGYAGVGAGLAGDGRSIWDIAKVPFISVLADAPYIRPSNHNVPSRYVVNGYIYREWLDLQQDQVGSRQISALLPMGVLPNASRALVPWSRRPRRMLFVKTGDDPDRQRAFWDRWPAPLRAVLHECADVLAARSPGPIAPVVQACLAAHSLLLDGNKGILFGVLHEVDTYIRALRATVMARALLQLPVDIVGGGWDHVRNEPGRARFHAPIPAGELEAAYADTQILVNVTPNFASGAHERVVRGFAAGCCVVSDDNDFSRSAFQQFPAYRGVEWHQPDLADRLASAYADQDASDAALEQARCYVEQRYDPAAFVIRMAELADIARMAPVFSGYQLEAA